MGLVNFLHHWREIEYLKEVIINRDRERRDPYYFALLWSDWYRIPFPSQNWRIRVDYWKVSKQIGSEWRMFSFSKTPKLTIMDFGQVTCCKKKMRLQWMFRALFFSLNFYQLIIFDCKNMSFCKMFPVAPWNFISLQYHSFSSSHLITKCSLFLLFCSLIKTGETMIKVVWRMCFIY